MRIILSAAFGGGAFYYAEQLDKRGYLYKWLTSRPDAVKKRVDRSRICVNILPEIVARLPRRVPGLRKWFPGDYLKAEIFDAWAKNKIENCDIIVAFADFALQTFRKAKASGAIAILERGSAHILQQRELMEEEYRQYGFDGVPMNERLLRKQLQEYEEADFIAVPSTFAWKTYVQHGIPPQKLICVPIGVDMSYFKPVPKTDGVFRIVCTAGGLRKGVQYLLEGMRQLELPGSEILLFGGISDKLKGVLEKYRGHYRYVGKIAHTDLYRYYSQGSVFVAPSVEDGWGLVVNEAMACGLPVICSANTGASDMIREGEEGFVVPARDVEALKEKIVYLYEHEQERQAMARSALDRIKEFTWDKYGERITQEYERVLAARRGRYQ